MNSLWLRLPPPANNPYRKWLTDKGSLTEKIKERSKGFKVIRCFQGVTAAGIDELSLMGCRYNQYTHVREVILVADNQPVVFAHSIAKLHDMRGTWRNIGKLGTRPLAEALFADPKVSRLDIEYGQINSKHYLFKKMQSYDLILPKRLWARRSLFLLKRRRLLVTEIFLPQIEMLQQKMYKASLTTGLLP